jgi:thymidine kinase
VHTQRLVDSEELIVVGASGAYEARCRRCFEPNPALAQPKKDGPQLIARNRAAGAGGS